jgi:hypothetical protein
MNSRIKRVLPIGFVVGVLGALAVAAPASATTGACQINGTAATNPPVQLSGGTGSYTFSTAIGGSPLSLRCAFTDGTIGTLDVNSTGTYAFIGCGTGTLDSTGNTVVSSSTLAAGSNPATMSAFIGAIAGNYHIQLVDFLGTIIWGRFAGWVAMSPGDCTTLAITGEMTGSF